MHIYLPQLPREYSEIDYSGRDANGCSRFMAMFSPPPPLSPPQSPMSTQSVPTGRRSSHLELPSSPTDSVASHRPTSYVTEMDHGHSSRLPPPHPPLPRSIPRRELSPMRFAAPSPPPLLHSHFDAFSIRSGVSNGVISRTSTISSGYRREQRTEALKHLEGRGADGALGRIKPRLSQNFMFLSDDEEENEGEELPSLGRGISVIVEEVDEMKADMEEAWARIVRDNVAEFSWYDGTPHASTLNVSTTETIEPQGDVNANIDEIFGLSPSSYASSPMTRTPSDKPRESKRSRRTKSPLPMMQPLPQPSIPLPKPSPNRSPARLYTPPSSRSPSHSPSFADPQSLPKPPAPPMHTRTSPGPSHSHPYDEHGIRLRTKSDVGSTSSRHQLLSADARARALRKGSAKAVPNAPSPRAPSNSRPRFLDVDNEDPSFIDMRDEPPDNDSHTDSWNSLFEVSCTA